MPTIADLPDEPKFTIKVVAAQTGVRPVTLRAWERRHAVLSPHRSENRYRLYSEKDVATLRWLKSRVDDGVSISNAVRELHGMTTQQHWPEALPTAPAPQAAKNAGPPAQYARRLAQLLMLHDESRATDLLREAHSIFDLTTLCTRIFVPALVEIGDAWYQGRIRVTTEHFASAFLRGALLTLLQAYPTRRNAPFILLGGAPTEQHELGALMLAVMLRSQGLRVEFLGPDLPLEDLVDYASYEHPAMIILSAATIPAAIELESLQYRLERLHPGPLFAYGGRAFDQSERVRQQVPGHYLGPTLDLAAANVQVLLGQPIQA